MGKKKNLPKELLSTGFQESGDIESLGLEQYAVCNRHARIFA